ncbi:ATP-binding cassette domain-containing protein [Nocardia mexicana]|uniref:Nickel import system ATP-binding protein NikD n=1 Tax=Nocardia mexicana TaxID=279262 RepID=A0A370H3K5_9NOCA|nr:ABC transporter ATP-binding protein [Nocardia mexicana]RDI50776.1 ABC-type dipeptide/oligopeptide/nickel transport system ATPase component [Nocardia mexicana]
MTLTLDGITVRIPLAPGRTVHAVTDAALEVRAGTVHGLIGESGSGKSMLGATVTGLLPRRARVAGTVTLTVGDRTLTGPEIQRARGHTVALVPQSAMTYFTPVRRIGPQLSETIRYLGTGHDPADLLDRVGLETSALQRYPHELSGGMAQRAAVAFALAADPAVIVADEPTSALDAERSAAILKLLAEFAGEGGRVLLITHDITALRESALCTELSVMHASRIVETGTATEVLDHPRHEYTRDLLAALPENGLQPIPHLTPSLVNLPDDYRYGAR